MWPQAGALGSIVDYRVSYGTDDWNDDVDKISPQNRKWRRFEST